MNDYKELIENLRTAGKSVELADGSFGIYLPTVEKCHYAADAIEQLVNDYETLVKMYAKVSEDLCVRTKERDAAVADLKELFTKNKSLCAFCVAEHCAGCIINYPYWKWRGVREEEHEID